MGLVVYTYIGTLIRFMSFLLVPGVTLTSTVASPTLPTVSRVILCGAGFVFEPGGGLVV